MKVKELINKLNRYNPNSDIFVKLSGDECEHDIDILLSDGSKTCEETDKVILYSLSKNENKYDVLVNDAFKSF